MLFALPILVGFVLLAVQMLWTNYQSYMASIQRDIDRTLGYSSRVFVMASMFCPPLEEENRKPTKKYKLNSNTTLTRDHTVMAYSAYRIRKEPLIEKEAVSAVIYKKGE